MKVDLHIHTTASDGQYSPEDVVKKAASCGLDCIAITDHDTLNGLDEAVEAGKKYGLTVLRGIELGAAEFSHLHILGLGLTSEKSTLSELCQKLKDSRDQRKYRIISFLQNKGIDVSLNEVEKKAGGQIIARPHFAQILVEKGYVMSTTEAFDRYLDTDEYQKIERFKATAKECISAIHNAGGKAVMAHPYQLNLLDENLGNLIEKLCSYGLDGIECYYPKHTDEQTKYYLELSQKYSLHVTSGSDFHGEKVKPDIEITSKCLDIKWIFQ